jgi:hypothetical protein
MHSLHFRKGCYVGQESISKTVSMTSNAVRRRLCALALSPSPIPSADRVLGGDLILDLDGRHMLSSYRAPSDVHCCCYIYIQCVDFLNYI